jgi:putative (di)nucleoside polyphosphate hydrolase
MTRPAQFFRAGVGAVLANRHGQVLVCERTDVAGAWQFPQGGLHAGEAPLDAAYRETEEETGLARASLRLRKRYPGLLAYELPAAARSARTGLGQVQYWYLFVVADGAAIELPAGGEFKNARWVSFAHAAARTVGFRRGLYRQLRAAFAPSVAAVRASRRQRAGARTTGRSR